MPLLDEHADLAVGGAFGRLAHAHGAGGPLGTTSQRTRTVQREKVRCVVPLEATSDVTL